MNSNRIFRDVKEKILSTGSVKTWKSYRSALNFFFGYFYGCEHPKHISQKEIVEFLSWMRQFHGDSMARTAFWATRFIYVEIEHQPNKFHGLKPIRIKSKPRIPLKKDYILGRIKDIENTKDKAMLWLLFCSGMRREEVATLKQENLLWDEQLISVTGKGNKTRLVQFPLEVQEIVRKHLSLQKPSIYVFAGEKVGHYISGDTILKKVRRYLDSCVHVVRNSWATDMKKAGVPIEDISRLLGHSQIQTTMRYIGSDPENIKNLYNPMKAA